MLDGDPTMLPDAAFTDALNVRFNGREITQYLGNQLQQYYTTDESSTYQPQALWLIDSVMFDAFSNNASMLFGMGVDGDDVCVWQQSMAIPEFAKLPITTADNFATGFMTDEIWTAYKCQINNCQIFGVQGSAPLGKQYDWQGFDALPAWGEQTVISDDVPVIEPRRWTCKKMVSFDNRLLLLSTIEEAEGGQDTPYPTRIRWSGFAQENAFPINWDDTAANRTPEDYASAVIDGYAGWQDLSSSYEVTDAAENGGTLYVYTARETYALSPSGNDESPFITKLLYSDLGCLDIGCCVNAHGYNYVFTGSDVARHDSVSWVSVADGAVKDYLADYVATHYAGMVRMINYPELSEIWLMMYGTDQNEGDYTKTIALTYNYSKKTWSKKTLPYINDACFCVLPPAEIGTTWDADSDYWDDANTAWDAGVTRTAQGGMIGACASGGVYLLNYGATEVRNIISGGAATMTIQPLQCYVERRGLEFNQGYRSMISELYLNGKGANDITVKIARADNPDSGYTWDSQTINLASQRISTWSAEGGAHGYRLEIAGQGDIPVGVSFTVVETGQ